MLDKKMLFYLLIGIYLVSFFLSMLLYGIIYTYEEHLGIFVLIIIISNIISFIILLLLIVREYRTKNLNLNNLITKVIKIR